MPKAGTAGGGSSKAVSAEDVSISVGSGSGGFMSECYIHQDATAAEGRPGYTAQVVMCGPGVAGTVVELGLPGLPGGGGLAVRVCTRDADKAGNGNAVLYVAGDTA